MWFKQIVQAINVCAGVYLPLFCSVLVVIAKIKNLIGRQWKWAISRAHCAFISMKVIHHVGFIPKKEKQKVVLFPYCNMLIKSVIMFDYGGARLGGICWHFYMHWLSGKVRRMDFSMVEYGKLTASCNHHYICQNV